MGDGGQVDSVRCGVVPIGQGPAWPGLGQFPVARDGGRPDRTVAAQPAGIAQSGTVLVAEAGVRGREECIGCSSPGQFGRARKVSDHPNHFTRAERLWAPSSSLTASVVRSSAGTRSASAALKFALRAAGHVQGRDDVATRSQAPGREDPVTSGPCVLPKRAGRCRGSACRGRGLLRAPERPCPRSSSPRAGRCLGSGCRPRPARPTRTGLWTVRRRRPGRRR